MIFKTTDYQSFLNKLNQITNIDIRILDNLYKLKLLNTIFTKDDNFIISNNNYIINKNLYLRSNYQSTISYLFTEYPLYNSNFKNFDNNIIGLELFKADNTLININHIYDLPFLIQLGKQQNNSVFGIYIYFNIPYSYFTNIDTDFLSEEEREIYQKFIFKKSIEKLENGNYFNFYNTTKQPYNKIYLHGVSILKFDEDKIERLKFFEDLNFYFEDLSIDFFDFIESIKNDNKDYTNQLLEDFLFKKQLINF